MNEVRIVYFAWIKERIGLAEETVQLPDSVVTVADLILLLSTKSDAHGEAFDDPDLVRVAIDQTHVPLTAEIAGAAEIAFFPPVTGG